MSRLFAICVCVLQIAILVQCNGLYSIVAPGTLRSKSNYHVTVSIHDAPSACKVKIGLVGPELDKTETVDVEPKSSKTVMFQLPKLKDGDYNLTAEGLSGIEFKNSTKLNFAAEKLSMYIQTDKATYKPGDKVQYRCLILDQNTRPAKIDGPVKISLYDGARNLIKQLNDVELTKGVYAGELQLSEFPVLGSWSIEMNADGTSETKNFEVDKYVLPKFEVQVEAPKDVAISDNKFTVTIRSKYTYGKPVKGTAVVTAKTSYYYYGDDNAKPMVEKTVKIDGKGRVEFDIANDFKLDKDRYTPPLTITAVVEEELTGLKQNSTASVNLHREKYQIQGVNTPYTYNPGKPVIINLVVKNLDGSPVQDTKNPVTLTVSPPDYWYRQPMPIPLLMTADSDSSKPTTTVPPPPKAKNYTATLDKDGMASFEIILPEDSSSTYYSVKASYLDSTSYVTSLSKFEKTETPVDESLKVIVQTKNPALGKDVSIRVQSGKPIPYFVYTIMARGDIVDSGYLEVPENRNYHVFKVTPTFSMIPQAKIFIHFVVGSDLQYAEETINFEKDFENSISIEAPIDAKPGQEVELKVKTDPDSYVGLLGVDQSVLLLKSGNDLQKDQIFNDLSQFDSSTPWSYGYGQYPGTQAGVVTMTNANHPFYQIFEMPLSLGILNDGPILVQNSVDYASQSAASGSDTSTPPIIRKDFPESWLWEAYSTESRLKGFVPFVFVNFFFWSFELKQKPDGVF